MIRSNWTFRCRSELQQLVDDRYWQLVHRNSWNGWQFSQTI